MGEAIRLKTKSKPECAVSDRLFEIKRVTSSQSHALAPRDCSGLQVSAAREFEALSQGARLMSIKNSIKKNYTPTLPSRPKNLILAQLPDAEYAALANHLVPVDLPLSMSLSEPNQPISHVYFLNSGLISTDATTSNGDSVEVGVVGREGFAGLAGLLGQPQMSAFMSGRRWKPA